MNRRLAVLLCLILLVLATAAPASGAKRNWSVLVGGSSKDFAVTSNAFHPRTLEIAVGDTVRWQFQGFHNVAFLGGGPMPAMVVPDGEKMLFNPQVVFPAGGPTYDGTGYRNSGIPLDPSTPYSYSLTFTKAGSYTYVCIIHGPGMGGRIIVGGRAKGTPNTASQAGRRGQSATLRAGQNLWATLQVSRMGNDVTVPMVGDLRTGASVMRFTRGPLRVAVGTTVTWTMRDPFELHTITFGAKKGLALETIAPQPAGPPKVYINPLGAMPSGGRTYDGAGFVNSGILWPQGSPPELLKSFSLTFVRKGRYEYICIPHAQLGMKGVVIVE